MLAMLSHSTVSNSVTAWTVGCQASLSMGILQAKILEWVAMPSSRGSSQPRDWTQVSCTAGGFVTIWAFRGSPRILEWVAYPFSRESSLPRNWTRLSCMAGGFFNQMSYQGTPISAYRKKEREVAQSCLTLCDPMGCSLQGSSIYGIFQARALDWVAISFSRGSSGPRHRNQVSHIVGRCFTIRAKWP